MRSTLTSHARKILRAKLLTQECKGSMKYTKDVMTHLSLNTPSRSCFELRCSFQSERPSRPVHANPPKTNPAFLFPSLLLHVSSMVDIKGMVSSYLNQSGVAYPVVIAQYITNEKGYIATGVAIKRIFSLGKLLGNGSRFTAAEAPDWVISRAID